MILVFSYYSGDVELALESAKAITAMGINMRHSAIVCCPNNTPFIDEVTEELKKSFKSVDRLVAQDGFDGWPLGPNQMFIDAASHCYNLNEPWYFWEPDCVPMKSGWLDDLDAEYHKKVGILGSIFPEGLASNGKNVYKAIVGSAIYPPNFLDFCDNARNLSNYNMAYRQAGVAPQPWDVYCRWEFLAIGRDTPLIRTYWKSVNYQWRGGDLMFFAEDPEAQAIQGVVCPDRVVSRYAVVVHGCKDGSLHRMASNHFIRKEETTEAKTEVKKSSIETKIVANSTTKRKIKITEEDRKRRSEAMKAIVAKRREQKLKSAV